jgi:hypothetical protein
MSTDMEFTTSVQAANDFSCREKFNGSVQAIKSLTNGEEARAIVFRHMYNACGVESLARVPVKDLVPHVGGWTVAQSLHEPAEAAEPVGKSSRLRRLAAKACAPQQTRSIAVDQELGLTQIGPCNVFVFRDERDTLHGLELVPRGDAPFIPLSAASQQPTTFEVIKHEIMNVNFPLLPDRDEDLTSFMLNEDVECVLERSMSTRLPFLHH